MTPPPSGVAALADLVRRQLAGLVEARPFLDAFPDLTPRRAPQPRQLPVCRWLAGLERYAAPHTVALVRALVDEAERLEWRQTYSAADFGPAFLQGYGWTEVIGLRGPIPSEQIACGFLLLAPELEYPAHAHEAEELYVPLAGRAQWMRGDEGFRERAPGALIEHASWTPHAMRTTSEPLLALYLWRGGDLAAKSRILSS